MFKTQGVGEYISITTYQYYFIKKLRISQWGNWHRNNKHDRITVMLAILLAKLSGYKYPQKC